MYRQQPLTAQSNDPNVAAVFGNNTNGGTGVSGASVSGYGTSGHSQTNAGLVGISQSGYGVLGESKVEAGVRATSNSGTGVSAYSENHFGVWALSNNHIGIFAMTNSNSRPALYAHNETTEGDIFIGSSRNAGEVFKVLNNGDVQVRGVKLTSDKNSKENFSNVNTLEVLENLASMPIQTWNYKDDTSSERHIGPTAQDFKAAFGLNGDDNTHISSIDLQGVALAAIQGLNEKNEKLKDENAQLHANFAKLEERLSALESKCQTQ